MRFMKRNYFLSLFLAGMMFCLIGCTNHDEGNTSDTSGMTELPPLLTSKQTTTSDVTFSESATVQAEPADPIYYHGVTSQWNLPAVMQELYRVRVYHDTIYILGASYDEETNEIKSILYWAKVEEDPEFKPVYENYTDSIFNGLIDFDVMSDGTLCGLLCENANEVPYEDPTFHPDEFDWEHYYENYATQYQLAWYSDAGQIIHKLGLSTLLELDESASQTMAFTGMRCDGEDHVYLTATIDEKEYLMALDENFNLCPVQGSSSKVLSLQSNYKWIRCEKDGMLLYEENNENERFLYHMILTDGTLWKTTVETPEYFPIKGEIAESFQKNIWYGIWNATGLYQMSNEKSEPQLLYDFSKVHIDGNDVDDVYILSEDKVIFTVYTSQGNLSLWYLIPEIEEESENDEDKEKEKTKPSYVENDPVELETLPAVATPVTIS